MTLTTVIDTHKKECFHALAEMLGDSDHIREELLERFRLGIPMQHPAYDSVVLEQTPEGWTCHTGGICRNELIDLLRR